MRFTFLESLCDMPAIRLNPVPGQPLPLLPGGHVEAVMRR